MFENCLIIILTKTQRPVDHVFFPKIKTQPLTCVDSLGYSEHSGVIDSVVAPTTAEI